MRYVWYTTAAVLLFATAVEAAPRRTAPRGLRRQAAVQPARRTTQPPLRELDLGKLPVYPGAELTQQVSLTGEQIASFSAAVPEQARAALEKLNGIQVLSYRLAKNAVPKNVLAFYEPRILASGYRVMAKDLQDAGETTGVYSGPAGVLLVVTVSGPELEIVSVKGNLAGLAGLGGLSGLESLEKLGTPAGKPVPEAIPASKPGEAPATPRSEQTEPEVSPAQ